MATVEIHVPLNRLIIRFDQEVPPGLLAQGQLYAYIATPEGNHYREIPTQYIAFEGYNALVPPRMPELIMEIFLPQIGTLQLGYLIDGIFRYAEEVRFSRQLLTIGYDPLTLGVRVRPFEKKGAKLAVLTQCYNEGDMLLYWERYYGELVGYENLYVLNNASTDGSCERLHPKTNVITMPAVEVDHVEFSQSQSYFQRFLLQRYQWVLKIDSDELVTIEGGLLERLDTLKPGTYVPSLALEPVHNIDTEAPFDFAGKVCNQRQHFVQADEGVIRPCLSSVPTTWTTGNHKCMEASAPLPGLTVVHLRFFDFDFLHSKISRWAGMQASKREIYSSKHISQLSELDRTGLHARSIKELGDHFAKPAYQVPAWVASVI